MLIRNITYFKFKAPSIALIIDVLPTPECPPNIMVLFDILFSNSLIPLPEFAHVLIVS